MSLSPCPPALADAADVLSGQLQAQLLRLAQVLQPHAAALEQRLVARLRHRYDARQLRALAAITPGAASAILAAGRPVSDFFEQVEYNGRRLAKLSLPPGKIVQTLRESERLLQALLKRLPARERENLSWAAEQLQFCVVLTLNNAFYQVRQAEADTYQELFRAELESAGLDELLRRMLQALCSYCHADAGAIFVFDRENSVWLRKAGAEGKRTEPVARGFVPGSLSQFRRLARAPRTGAGRKYEALEAAWAGRYCSCWTVPLGHGGKCAGVMQFGFERPYDWLPRELELLTTAAERCLLAAEKALLVEQLGAREAQLLRLAGRMMQVEERERKRISNELHDEAGQSLLCIRLQLEMLERAAPPACARWKAGLSEVRVLAEKTIEEVRRIIGALSPAVLEQLGLPAALRQLAGRLRRFHRLRVLLRISSLPALPQRMASLVYRLVQECTNNVVRHSGAAEVKIAVRCADGILRLSVEDDGAGFHIADALSKRDSFGLAGMRERVNLFGGELAVESWRLGGTRIQIELPLPRAAGEEQNASPPQ